MGRLTFQFRETCLSSAVCVPPLAKRPALPRAREFGKHDSVQLHGATLRDRGETRVPARNSDGARNRGVDTIFIHALSENTAMLKIARNAGATLQRDGSESEAWLKLAPDSLLFLAEAMTTLGDTNSACIALAEFSETYPALATGRLKEQYDRNRSKVTCR